MFSKAKIKRFNEEIGCAPPPTKYNVKSSDKLPGGCLDKSNRWNDIKELTPGPTAYNVTSMALTPKRTDSQLSKLNVSTCSSNSSQGNFISPTKYFSRSKSFKNPRMKETREVKLKARIDALLQENKQLQESVHALQQSVSMSEASSSKSEATHSLVQEEPLDLGRSTAAIQTEASTLESEEKAKNITTTISADELELLKDQVEHLTLLRDNLEETAAHKDDLVADLREQIDIVASDAHHHQERAENLFQEVEQIRSKLEETFEEKIKAESKVKDLIAKYEALFAETKDAMQKNKEIVAQKDIEIELLNDSVSTLNTQVAEYEKAVKRTQAEISLRLLQISSLEITVGDLSIASKEKEVMETVLEDEIKEKNIEMTKLEKSLAEVENKVVDVIRDRDKLSLELQAEKEKNSELTSKVSCFEVNLKEMEVLQQFLEKEITAREAEVNDLNKKMRVLEDDLEMARKVALDLQEEAESRLNQIFCLKASLSAKDYDLDTKDDLISSLQNEVTQADTQKTKVSQRVAELEVERDSLNQTKSEELTGIEAQLKEVREALQLERENTQQLQEKVIQLMAEVGDREEEHKKKVLEKDSELEELSVKYSDALLDQEAAKRILACTSEELSNVKMVLEATERELSTTKAQLEIKKQENEGLETSLKELAVKFTHLEDALACEEAESREVQDRLQRRLKALQESIALAEKENADLKTSNTAFMARITHLRIDMEKKAMAVVEMQRCIELLRDERTQLSASLSGAESSLREKEDLLSDLQEEFEGKLRSITDLQGEVQQKALHIQTLEETLAEKAKRLSAIEGNVSSLEQKFSFLDTQLAAEVEEKSAYKVKVLELEEKLAESKSDHEKSLVCLHSQMEEKDRIVSSLSNEVHNLKAKYEGYEDQLVNLQSSLLEKTSETERFEETFREMNSRIENQSQSFEQLKEEKENLLRESSLLKEELSSKEDLLRQLDLSARATNDRVAHLELEVKSREEKEASFESALEEARGLLERLSLGEEPSAPPGELSREALLKKLARELRRLIEAHKDSEAMLELVNSSKQSEVEDLLKLNQTLQQEAQVWRSKFEYLEQMIEPFREQLDAFELERSALLSTTSAAQEEMTKLSQDYAKLLGHHNHKQKIQHILKMKSENNELKQEVQKLRCEVEKHKKSLRRMEDRSEKPLTQSKSKPPVVHKENKENSAAFAATTGPPTTPQIATTTPLRSSNRLHRI